MIVQVEVSFGFAYPVRVVVVVVCGGSIGMSLKEMLR